MKPLGLVNAQGVCLSPSELMHKGCALALSGLSPRSLAGPTDIPHVPDHAFPVKTGLPNTQGLRIAPKALIRKGCVLLKRHNARGSSINPNALMLKGGALAALRLPRAPNEPYPHLRSWTSRAQEAA